MAPSTTPRVAHGADAATAPAGSRLARCALAAYWPLLFTSTHVPHLHIPLQNQFSWISFALHFTCYAVLTVLLLRSFVTSGGLQHQLRTVAILLAVAAAYGAFDEITQPLFQRDADFRDWLCDIGGAAGGTLLVAALDAWVARRRP